MAIMTASSRLEGLLGKLSLEAVNPGASSGVDGWIADENGDELVSVSNSLKDVAGNAATGTVTLQGRDLSAPEFTRVDFNDVDGNQQVSLGDSFTITFNEAVKQNAQLLDRLGFELD